MPKGLRKEGLSLDQVGLRLPHGFNLNHEVACLRLVQIVGCFGWVQSKSLPVFNSNCGVALLLLLQVLHSHFCFSILLFINVFVFVACSGLLLLLLLALGCWVASSRCFVLQGIRVLKTQVLALAHGTRVFKRLELLQ